MYAVCRVNMCLLEARHACSLICEAVVITTYIFFSRLLHFTRLPSWDCSLGYSVYVCVYTEESSHV